MKEEKISLHWGREKDRGSVCVCLLACWHHWERWFPYSISRAKILLLACASVSMHDAVACAFAFLFLCVSLCARVCRDTAWSPEACVQYVSLSHCCTILDDKTDVMQFVHTFSQHHFYTSGQSKLPTAVFTCRQLLFKLCVIIIWCMVTQRTLSIPKFLCSSFTASIVTRIEHFSVGIHKHAVKAVSICCLCDGFVLVVTALWTSYCRFQMTMPHLESTIETLFCCLSCKWTNQGMTHTLKLLFHQLTYEVVPNKTLKLKCTVISGPLWRHTEPTLWKLCHCLITDLTGNNLTVFIST